MRGIVVLAVLTLAFATACGSGEETGISVQSDEGSSAGPLEVPQESGVILANGIPVFSTGSSPLFAYVKDDQPYLARFDKATRRWKWVDYAPEGAERTSEASQLLSSGDPSEGGRLVLVDLRCGNADCLSTEVVVAFRGELEWSERSVEVEVSPESVAVVPIVLSDDYFVLNIDGKVYVDGGNSELVRAESLDGPVPMATCNRNGDLLSARRPAVSAETPPEETFVGEPPAEPAEIVTASIEDSDPTWRPVANLDTDDDAFPRRYACDNGELVVFTPKGVTRWSPDGSATSVEHSEDWGQPIGRIVEYEGGVFLEGGSHYYRLSGNVLASTRAPQDVLRSDDDRPRPVGYVAVEGEPWLYIPESPYLFESVQ